MSNLDSESSTSSSDESCRLDAIGRPLTRPVYGSVEESSVLLRVREFLPQLQAATRGSIMDPLVTSEDREVPVELPSRNAMNDQEDDSDASESSFGVEIDVGCGVFDVMGNVDDTELASGGIPTIYSDAAALPQSKVKEDIPLIQEIERSD